MNKKTNAEKRIYELDEYVRFRWKNDKTEWHGVIHAIENRHGNQYLTISCLYDIKLPSFMVVPSNEKDET